MKLDKSVKVASDATKLITKATELFCGARKAPWEA